VGVTRLLLAAALRSRRRGLKRQTGRTADMLFAAWVTLVAFIRFTLNAALAVRESARGSRLAGLAIAEFCSLHALGVGLLFTFLVSSLSIGTMGLDKRRIVLSPAPFGSLVLSELAGLLSSPVSAIVAAFLVPAVLPLAFLPSPVAAICSLLLCFAAALCIGSAASALLASGPRAAKMAGPFRIVFAVVMIGLVLANFDFQWKGGPVRLYVFLQGTLLDDGAGRGLLPRLGPWSPSAWIAARGVPAWAGLLLSAGLAGAGAALFGLAVRGSLTAAARGPTAAASRGRRKSRPVPGGRLWTVLFLHELQSLAARGSARVGAAAAAAVTVWTLLARDSAVAIPLFGAVIALAALFPSASNIFGADGPALRRYIMLSPDWGAVFSSRHAAVAAAALAFLAPLAAAAGIRLSFPIAISFALAGLLAAAVQCLWGIVSSMLLPSAETGPRARAPAFVNQAAGVAAWAVPWALHRGTRFGTTAYALSAGACLAAAALLYAAVLRRIRGRFSQDAEAVLARM
jgi:hypothetical protein